MSYKKSLRRLEEEIAKQGFDEIKVSAKKISEALKLERDGNSEAASELFVSSIWTALIESDLGAFQEDVDKYKHKVACKKSAEYKRKDVHDRHAEWQDEAVMIWNKYPWKSALEVARDIAESESNDNDYKVSLNTIFSGLNLAKV